MKINRRTLRKIILQEMGVDDPVLTDKEEEQLTLQRAAYSHSGPPQPPGGGGMGPGGPSSGDVEKAINVIWNYLEKTLDEDTHGDLEDPVDGGSLYWIAQDAFAVLQEKLLDLFKVT